MDYIHISFCEEKKINKWKNMENVCKHNKYKKNEYIDKLYSWEF